MMNYQTTKFGEVWANISEDIGRGKFTPRPPANVHLWSHQFEMNAHPTFS